MSGTRLSRRPAFVGSVLNASFAWAPKQPLSVPAPTPPDPSTTHLATSKFATVRLHNFPVFESDNVRQLPGVVGAAPLPLTCKSRTRPLIPLIAPDSSK